MAQCARSFLLERGPIATPRGASRRSVVTYGLSRGRPTGGVERRGGRESALRVISRPLMRPNLRRIFGPDFKDDFVSASMSNGNPWLTSVSSPPILPFDAGPTAHLALLPPPGYEASSRGTGTCPFLRFSRLPVSIIYRLFMYGSNWYNMLDGELDRGRKFIIWREKIWEGIVGKVGKNFFCQDIGQINKSPCWWTMKGKIFSRIDYMLWLCAVSVYKTTKDKLKAIATLVR